MQVKKYIIPTVLFLISLILKFSFTGYGFLSLIFALSGIAILLLQLLSINETKLKRIIKKVIYYVIAIGIVCIIIPTIPIVINSKNKENISSDYCLILGCAVHGDYPSRVLNERINAGYKFLIKNPDCKAILCGGKGKNENISEAECIFNRLVEKGIDQKRLILENKSTNTSENVKFAKCYIPGNSRVTIITSETHAYRASFLAKRNNINVIGTYSAKTHFPIVISNYLRECAGVWKDWIIR